ncbi:MAG TPA: hypothetical protein PKA30_06225 [Accumulibacter sp.]|uniref:hypothetical protein n=1 Tax=Accumulibacter sp. TaxID=2053492 RepID=UPI0028798A12|nr:hypothetical protein [Accumulibacter sp.]HNC66191.1 hypothetical protein [Thauera aminoaromatica]HNL91052.1 hypothetical protein [Nitrospira sp.]MDS4056472.1 hypothetical protein [Accumulibacter sp.]HMV05131.1 hypothetical protein [Accumulibacter sp.]HMW56410.1 hypothetical protein [Accumulibacter sp.]
MNAFEIPPSMSRDQYLWLLTAALSAWPTALIDLHPSRSTAILENITARFGQFRNIANRGANDD